MNSTKKKENVNQNPKTKEMLQEELSKTQKNLIQSRNEMKKVRKKLNEANSELNKLKEALQDSKKQQEESNQKITDLRQTKLRLQEEKETLEKQLADQNSFTHEEISAAKSTFHINIYPRQGQFQCKIVHPLTKDKEVFTGLDSNVILNFISSHLPKTTDNDEDLFQSDTQQFYTTAGLPGASSEIAERRWRLIELETKTIDTGAPIVVLHHKQPYAIDLTIDFKNLKFPKGTTTNHEVAVFAKRLGSSERYLIAEAEDVIELTETKHIKMKGKALQPGRYKMHADVTLDLQGFGLTSEIDEIGFFEGRVIRVI